MNLLSVRFALFFFATFILYFRLPARWRLPLLLLASYYFYISSDPVHIILLLLSTLLNYALGNWMGRTQDQRRRRAYLLISLTFNLGSLFLFKYLSFFTGFTRNVGLVFGLTIDVLSPRFLLPLGISFYTFQAISYIIEVYRGRLQAEANIGFFALYIAFFPKLVAGPIERAGRLLAQFRAPHDFDYLRARDGLYLMAWGFFKKLVIADRLASYVNVVFAEPGLYNTLPSLVAVYFFAIQMYCDFSGYSDIAIGAARILGYDLMVNFRRPYLSQTIREFWQRWHISLTSWFRDYVYLPMGGNRVAQPRWYLNIMTVFLLSGLWHGANYTFLIWGCLHGFYYLASEWTARPRGWLTRRLRLERASSLMSVFNVLVTGQMVCFAWIFFRADSLGAALRILRNITAFNFRPGGWLAGMTQREFSIGLVMIVVLFVVEIFQERVTLRDWVAKQPRPVRWAIYYMAIMLLTVGSFFLQNNEFIYFRF